MLHNFIMLRQYLLGCLALSSYIITSVHGAPTVAWSSKFDEIVAGHGETDTATIQPLHAPEYVQGLYLSYSNESAEPQKEYNTIRSFENTAKDGCVQNVYTFRFNTSAIMQTELIHKSQLRVYLDVMESIDDSEVEILLLLLNGTEIHTRTITASSSQWLEFSVGPVINEWLRNTAHNSTTGFKIIIKQNSEGTTPSSDCYSNLKIRTQNVDDYLPLLTVYSYDTDESPRPFAEIVEKAMEKAITSINSNSTMRPKRAVSNSTEPCSKKLFRVSTKWLNEYILENHKIIGPDEIDINYCQGTCPKNVFINRVHSALLYLFDIKEHQNFNRDEFCQYCVPLEYTQIKVLIKDSSAYVMRPLGEISVKSCGCIYVNNV